MVVEEFRIESIGKDLLSTEKRDRQKALNSLLVYLRQNDLELEVLTTIYDQVYIQLLKCYADKYESCRELGCEVVSEFIEKLPRNDYYLQQIVSTIFARLGQKETVEESEEIRLILVSQLRTLIEKFRSIKKSEDLLLKPYNEIIDILKKALTDRYSNVQREACNCINILAEATPSFHYRAEILTKPLYLMIRHKHSTSRTYAIKTLGTVAVHILSNSERVVEILCEISPMLMDNMPVVRLECGRVGCKFLLELQDRYSFFGRILPLVLCSLNDDSSEIRNEIEILWKKCGEKFYEENEEELGKLLVVDSIIPQYYPKNVTRPTIGCRYLARRGSLLVKLILEEVSDWKPEVRHHALKLLWQVILHIEDDITSYLQDLYPVLSRACADEEKIVATQAMKTAELLGILTDCSVWYKYAIEGVKKNARLGYLKCLYAIIATPRCLQREQLCEIVEVLSGKDIANNLKPQFQDYILKITDETVQKFVSKSCDLVDGIDNLNINESVDFIENVYIILIKVICLSYDEPEKNEIHHNGNVIASRLCSLAKSSIDQLHERYLNKVITECLECLDTNLSADDEPILLLYGIICVCGFREAYLEELVRCISVVWNYDVPEAKVKIFTGISIALLKWNETMETSSHDKKLACLQELVKHVIVDHLIWKPGAVAESMRALATGSLYSVSENSLHEAQTIFSEHTSLFTSLIDDNRVSTRLNALKCMTRFPPIKSDFFRKLSKEIVERLDDPCNEVREWTARAIPKIKMEIDNDSDKSLFETFLSYAFDALFLHLEGPEIKLKEIIKNSIIEMGKEHQDQYRRSLEKAYISKDDPYVQEIEAKIHEMNEADNQI